MNPGFVCSVDSKLITGQHCEISIGIVRFAFKHKKSLEFLEMKVTAEWKVKLISKDQQHCQDCRVSL